MTINMNSFQTNSTLYIQIQLQIGNWHRCQDSYNLQVDAHIIHVKSKIINKLLIIYHMTTYARNIYTHINVITLI